MGLQSTYMPTRSTSLCTGAAPVGQQRVLPPLLVYPHCRTLDLKLAVLDQEGDLTLFVSEAGECQTPDHQGVDCDGPPTWHLGCKIPG